MPEWIAWLVTAFALAAAVAALYVLRKKSRVKGSVNGPLGMALRVEADDDQPGGKITLEDITAKKGSVGAVTGLGGVVGMQKVVAGQDVTARTDSVNEKK